MSIFKETFKDFVFKQFRIREAIIENGNNPTKFQHRFGNPRINIEGKNGESTNVKIAAGAFYTNTVHKQCVIRMSSGVDITNNDILETSEKNLVGKRLAERYVLEGGVLDENKKQKEGFARNNGAYGDKSTRSNAGEGFGIVPMPGIIDADIRTKTAYGSLREAKVNFVCHNRRQLEILELLYMRPGMPVLLEWQWSPFINNEGNIDNKTYGIGNDWFTYKKTLSDFNEIVIETKEKTGGNYDGFVGFCKNFEISSRPDGGYDCTTELIAMGEVLEGLKARRDGYSVLSEDKDVRIEIDNMELILKGILELSDLNSVNSYGVFSLIDEKNSKFTNEEDFGKRRFLKEDQPSGILLEILTENTIGDPTQGKGNNKQFIVNEFLKQYTDEDFLWKGEYLPQTITGTFLGARVISNNVNIHHTYMNWKTLCDLTNKLVFPLHDPTNDTEPLLKLAYTELKKDEDGNVKPFPLKIVPYVFGKDFISKGPPTNSQERSINKASSILDNSFNPKICLLPNTNTEDLQNIGSVMLNVKHLVDTYREMAYSGNTPVEDFNLFDYFKKIWDDVNTACLGHHNFTLHSDSERLNRVRIIDLKVDPPNIPIKDLFEFKIQGNKSIVRDFNYNTTIPSSLSATIAIAAQAPSNISDFDQVTFANFSKDIRSRFAKNGDHRINANKKGSAFLTKSMLDSDLNELDNKIKNLEKYLNAIYAGQAEENEVLDTTYGDIQNLGRSIESLIFSILSRDQQTGKKLEFIPNRKSAVIPLKFNCKLDGVGGIVIGNVFKVEKEKLPKGYQAEDIAFVVMGESQKITADQDWVTEISGQLVLLDLNPEAKKEIIIENDTLIYGDQTLETDNLTVVNTFRKDDISEEGLNTVEDQVLGGPIPTYEAEVLLNQIKGNGKIYVGTSADQFEAVAALNAKQIAKRSLLSSIGLIESYTTNDGEIQWENNSFIEIEREYDGFNITIKFKFE